MSRPALPEERGADLRPDPPTLDDLRRAHEWRTDHRGEDGRYLVDVCRQCGREELAGSRGASPPCEAGTLSEHQREEAVRLGYLDSNSSLTEPETKVESEANEA